MGNESKQGQSSKRHLNDYERSKRLRVQENQQRLQELGVTNIAKSLTSLVESEKTKKRKKKLMDTSEKDVEYMPEFDVDGEQDYGEEDTTRVRVSKKPPRPQYIAPMSMNRYANLAKQRVIAPNVSHVLPSMKSRMLNRQLIDTSRAIKSRVEESQEAHKRNSQLVDTIPAKQNQSRDRVTMGKLILNKRGTLKQTEKLKQNLENFKSTTTLKSSVARRKLFVIDHNDDDREGDMTVHDMIEEQDGAENDNVEDMEQTIIESNDNDDTEDVDVNEVYEEHGGFEDDGDEDMDDSENDELVQEEHEVSQPENEAVENVRKRVRGPTRMPKIWAQEQGDRIPIIVNELGQPINDESSRLTHFMGTLSRSGKYCSVHTPWNKVDDTKKKNLLEFLKTKFDIPKNAETWILKSFGRKVKNWRARIKEYYHDPSLSLQEQINSRPKQVQKKQWKRLVKYWNKEKSKRVSEKNKANRAKKKMVQVTGKKSYARVREELKASLGQDPSRLEMFRTCFSKDGTTKNVEAANAIVGDEVFLKSILNSTETVARGRVKSLDPNEQIGGKEIGREWCEVNVQVAIKRDENLVRPYGLFVTIEDAIGASIAWPCPFISVIRED